MVRERFYGSNSVKGAPARLEPCFRKLATIFLLCRFFAVFVLPWWVANSVLGQAWCRWPKAGSGKHSAVLWLFRFRSGGTGGIGACSVCCLQLAQHVENLDGQSFGRANQQPG